MLDAWRLAVGTLTAIPVKPPGTVDRRTARGAVLLAPLAVAPIGAAVWLVGWLMTRYVPFSPASGVVTVAVVVLGTRAFHLDGLSDTADGLASSYDRERSLTVMRSGNAGPAGVVAIVLVLGLQVLSLGQLLERPHGALVAGITVCLSRWALLSTCERGRPSARIDGLGAAFAESVPRLMSAALWVVLVVVGAALARWEGIDAWFGIVPVLVAAVVLELLVLRARRRLGGVTGDVYGAGIEVTLAILLAGLAGGVLTLYTASYHPIG